MAARHVRCFRGHRRPEGTHWPDIIFRDCLELAFKNRRIDSHEHPILKALAGGTVMLDSFREVVFCDFEFQAEPGERPAVHCLVAHELRSGRRHRLWEGELGNRPPFPTGPDVLFVAYYASAELGCFLSLGWQMPERILDLYRRVPLSHQWTTPHERTGPAGCPRAFWPG